MLRVYRPSAFKRAWKLDPRFYLELSISLCENPTMPKRSSIDAQSISNQVAQEAEAQPGKNPAAVALGRMGGLKGGKARAASLTPKRRKAIAKKAAKARWGTPEK